MSTDLKYLAFTAVLTASLWIPYIACQVMTNGNLAPQNYIDPTPRKVPLWGMRAYRAHLNAVETLAPFAALVIVVHLAGKANATTALWSMVFFWTRVVHAIVFWFGVPYLRTLSFTVGYIAVLALFWQLL